MKFLVAGKIVLVFCFSVVVYDLNDKEETIRELKTEITNSEVELDKLSRVVEMAFLQDYHSNTVFSKVVTATGYTARVVECDSTPWYTASMELSRVGVIAISPDLEALGIKLGQFIIIKGMGLFKVSDRMNPRWRNRIDIMMGNITAAKLFGKQEVTILWLGDSHG